jgi:hypothetical protein
MDRFGCGHLLISVNAKTKAIATAREMQSKTHIFGFRPKIALIHQLLNSFTFRLYRGDILRGADATLLAKMRQKRELYSMLAYFSPTRGAVAAARGFHYSVVAENYSCCVPPKCGHGPSSLHQLYSTYRMQIYRKKEIASFE